MKARAIGTTLALCLVGATLCLAADGFLGTWKIERGQVDTHPGTAKNSTVVYSTMGRQHDGHHRRHRRRRQANAHRVDGQVRRQRLPGSPAIPLPTRGPSKKIDDHTLTFTVKKGDKVLVTGRIVLSADGKTRTVTTEGTDSTGKKISATAVYDKQ